MREVAPGVAARGWYAATWAPTLLSFHLPGALRVTPPGAWGGDPWGRGFGGWPIHTGAQEPWSHASFSAGPDGHHAFGADDDVVVDRGDDARRLRFHADRPPWPRPGEVAWWLFVSTPPFAAPLAAYLLTRRLGRRGPSPRRARALATLLPLAPFVWYGGAAVCKPLFAAALEHMAFPTLVPKEVAAVGTVGVGLWALLLGLDLALPPREPA